MSHTVRKRFTPDEWRAIYLSIAHSNNLKHRRLKNPDAKQEMHDYYADGLEKLIAFQEQGWDIICNRSTRDLKANLFGWWTDQLTYTQKRWDPPLADNSGYQLAIQVLEDRATGRRPGPGTIYDQLFGDDDDHDDQE
jgi:hypothetical protein